MDLRAGLDILENIKISCSFRDSDPASSSDCRQNVTVQSVLSKGRRIRRSCPARRAAVDKLQHVTLVACSLLFTEFVVEFSLCRV